MTRKSDPGDRLQRLRVACERKRLDGILVTHLPNLRYLTGFTGSNGICLVTETNAIFVTDGRYASQVEQEVRGATIVTTREPLAVALRRSVGSLANARIGFEANHIPYQQMKEFFRLFSQANWQETVNLVEELTIQKDAYEIDCLRRAARLADEILEQLLPQIKPGINEIDLAAEIEYLCRRKSGERAAFEPIVASGPRSALPHARPSSRKLSPGEFVIIDFGCRVEGYCSDLTRTFAISPINTRQKKIYTTVQAAQEAAIETARAGIPCSELDRIARKIIEDAGFGAFFPHSLGHGLGLEVHAPPKLSESNDSSLLAGTVVTIEPGIYIPGLGGVRIEDDVLIGNDFAERLTSFNRELIAVGG